MVRRLHDFKLVQGLDHLSLISDDVSIIVSGDRRETIRSGEGKFRGVIRPSGD